MKLKFNFFDFVVTCFVLFLISGSFFYTLKLAAYKDSVKSKQIKVYVGSFPLPLADKLEINKEYSDNQKRTVITGYEFPDKRDRSKVLLDIIFFSSEKYFKVFHPGNYFYFSIGEEEVSGVIIDAK